MPSRQRVDRLVASVPSGGLADAVSRRLAEAIHLGLLEPGEQLPSEAALAGQLSVSTVTLREALSELRRKGLVETRRGRHGGSFVCGPVATTSTRLRQRLRAQSVIGLRDLGDEWAAIAGAAARLAAERSSTAQVAQLRAFAGRLAAATSIGDRSRAHSRFFIELALASQSERLTRAEVRLQSEIGDLLWINDGRALDVAEVSAQLGAIADAVEAEHGRTARALAQDHIVRLTRWLIESRLDLSDRDDS